MEWILQCQQANFRCIRKRHTCASQAVSRCHETELKCISKIQFGARWSTPAPNRQGHLRPLTSAGVKYTKAFPSPRSHGHSLGTPEQPVINWSIHIFTSSNSIRQDPCLRFNAVPPQSHSPPHPPNTNSSPSPPNPTPSRRHPQQ